MKKQLYINGEWVSPDEGRSFDVVNPATEEVIHQAPAGGEQDINNAVASAKRAFESKAWKNTSGAERAAYLHGIADCIERDTQKLAEMEVADNGKPLPEAIWDIEDTAGCFRFYADLAIELDKNKEESIALPHEGFRCRVTREPIGVAGGVIPWNFPMLMAAWKVAPAIAAGATMVLKPSELTPLTALEFGTYADEVSLPPGVLNVVTGLGADAGAPLASHPDVAKLAFTGSVPTGSKIMAAAAQDIKNVSLELGGKSAFIVFDDADVEAAVEWILFGIFWNQGEVCSATSRLIVQQGIADKLMARLVEEAEKIKIGNGMHEGVLLGPLVSKGQFDKVLRFIDEAKNTEAEMLCGGSAGFDKGYFVKPTIFMEPNTNNPIWTEEVFGPVLAVKRFASEEEAVELANGSRFGLGAAVMSADKERCARVANAFRAGIVWVNCSQPTFVEAPWGGYKQSGIGRELGRWGLNNYLETKQITEYVSNEPWGWYLKN